LRSRRERRAIDRLIVVGWRLSRVRFHGYQYMEDVGNENYNGRHGEKA